LYSISIHPLAEEDLETAIRWYNDQRNGLGFELLAELDSKLLELSKTPLNYPIRYSDKRICRTGRRFPYFIHYSVSQNRVSIIAIFHGARNSNRWVNRDEAVL
jgi:toxin ParE1/3/4